MGGLRDLLVLGLGVLGAVLCLTLPLSLGQRFGLGVAALALGMVAALLRVGRDLLPPEVWLWRRLRYRLRPRRYVYVLEAAPPGRPPEPSRRSGERSWTARWRTAWARAAALRRGLRIPHRPSPPRRVVAPSPPPSPPPPVPAPGGLVLVPDAVGTLRLVGAAAVFVAAAVLVWLREGGLADLLLLVRLILSAGGG